MNYQQIVSNIKKLMDFWGLNLSELAEKSGLTLNGLRHMLTHGKFKYESLFKIAETLQVPVVVLMADELSVQQNIDGREYSTIIIRWHCNERTGIETNLKGRKALLAVIFSQRTKEQNEEDEIEIINLRTELKEKNDHINELYEKLEMANTLIVMATKAIDSNEKYINQLESRVSEATGLDISESGKKPTIMDKLNVITEKFVQDLLKKKND
jgi:transcriptional regulator with XRE-family HTH domain